MEIISCKNIELQMYHEKYLIQNIEWKILNGQYGIKHIELQTSHEKISNEKY